MGQAAYPITDEERAIGVVFKELFTSPSLCAKNGTVLVGFPAVNRGITLNGTTQYATNPKRLSLNGQGFIVIRFTPSFNWNENTARVIIGAGSIAAANSLYIYKHTNANLDRIMCYFGTGYVYCNGADYSAYWLVGEENVLVVSWNGTSSAMWLNGNALAVTDVAMALNNVGLLTMGAATGGSSFFAGSIQSLIIGNRPLTQGCEERLITPEPLSRIRTERSLVTIPGVQAYNRASDGFRVTPLLGKIATQHGVTEAVLGDGTTATTFPALLTPRGFSFDGGDYLNLGDNDVFSFTNGVNDLPFSVAAQFRLSSIATNPPIAAKYQTSNIGEWKVYVQSTGRLIFILVDESVPIYFQIYTAINLIKVGIDYTVVATYTGSGGANGLSLYLNGVKQSVTLDPQTYVRMRNTNQPVYVGRDTIGAYTAGNIILPEIYDVELSECEVRAITARLQRQARIGS